MIKKILTFFVSLLGVLFANSTVELRYISESEITLPDNVTQVLWSIEEPGEATRPELVASNNEVGGIYTQEYTNIKFGQKLGFDQSYKSSGINTYQYINPDGDCIVSHGESENLRIYQILNASGNVIADYTMVASDYHAYHTSLFGDGRLIRINIKEEQFEILSSKHAEPIILLKDYDRRLQDGDKWSGLGFFYNKTNRDIIARFGVVKMGVETSVVMLIDKDSNILWTREYDCNGTNLPQVNIENTGELFTIFRRTESMFKGDLEVLNRKGDQIQFMEDVTAGTEGHQIISVEDNLLTTLVRASEIYIYSLSSGELVKHIRGYGGSKNILSIDYSPETRSVYSLIRGSSGSGRKVDLVVFHLDQDHRRPIIVQEIVSQLPNRFPRGEIHVSRNAGKISVRVENKFYELRRDDK